MRRNSVALPWYSQIGDVPSIDQCLDYESIVTRFPKIRLALASLRSPICASAKTSQKYVLNAALPPEAIKLLCIVHSTTEFQPFTDHPVVLDVWSVIDTERIRELGAVLGRERRRDRLRSFSGPEYITHGIRETIGEKRARLSRR